jgi:signal transduction histidine kinase
VARPQARQRDVQIEAGLGAGRDRVSGDAEQLEAAFLNLFLNGLDAAEGEGRQLRVVTENRGGDRIVIRVLDSGPGIGAEARDLVFRPFYSSKSAGSGFGLPLALRTFEEHGGDLVLEEDPAPLGGAAFRVDLPLLPEDDGE